MLSIVSSSIAFAPVSISKYAARSLTTMSIKKGDTIPNVIFKARVRDDSIGGSNPFDWKDVSTDDLFKNKRAVVFALPGGPLIDYSIFIYKLTSYTLNTYIAFTPTCSSTHLPGYEEKYGNIYINVIDNY